MGKTEIILTLIILLLIIFGFWFIFSGEIWYLVEFLENSLYPTFDAPSRTFHIVFHLPNLSGICQPDGRVRYASLSSNYVDNESFIHLLMLPVL